MPKLLPKLRERLLARSRERLKSQGYAALSIRDLARDCGVATGTIYNYFPDKDTIVATVMLEDWERCLERVRAAAEETDRPEPVLRSLHAFLGDFAREYRALFRDETAWRSFSSGGRLYHARLRSSLSAPLRKFFSDPFLPDFIAEAILYWTMEGKRYEELAPVLARLCDSNHSGKV